MTIDILYYVWLVSLYEVTVMMIGSGIVGGGGVRGAAALGGKLQGAAK